MSSSSQSASAPRKSGISKKTNKVTTRSQYVNQHTKLEDQIKYARNHREFLLVTGDKDGIATTEKELEKLEKKLSQLENTVHADIRVTGGLQKDLSIDTQYKQQDATADEQQEAPEKRQQEAPSDRQQEAPADRKQEAPADRQHEATADRQQEAPAAKQQTRPPRVMSQRTRGTKQENYDMEEGPGVDDLNIEWNITGQNQSEDLLEDIEQAVYGHLIKNSTMRYCVRYGSSEACSSRFESQPPRGTSYDNRKDVTQRSSRIIERIVQFHRDRKEQVPMGLLGQAKVLSVYWDCKTGVGHAADVDVLAPSYGRRRPNTRCYVYLEPKLYARYNLENQHGYSHETFSIMKLCVKGIDDWQKCIELHNIAVRLENKFEEYHMKGAPGRPAPLQEILDDQNPRSSISRISSIEPSQASRRTTPRRTPRPHTPRPTTPVVEDKSASLIDRFHKEYLILFRLPENTRYADLSERDQILYPSQFSMWKKAQ